MLDSASKPREEINDHKGVQEMEKNIGLGVYQGSVSLDEAYNLQVPLSTSVRGGYLELTYWAVPSVTGSFIALIGQR